MDEIEFTKEGITLRELVTAFGETKTEEMEIQYEEREGWEIDFDSNGYVSLMDIVNVELNENGGISSIVLQLDNAPTGEAKIRPHKNMNDTDGIPPVPDINISEIEIESRADFYRRMRDNPDSQPSTIRKCVYSEKELTQQELEQVIERNGYKSSGGGLSQSLVVLEKVTQEIERQGRGSDKRITWVGGD